MQVMRNADRSSYDKFELFLAKKKTRQILIWASVTLN